MPKFYAERRVDIDGRSYNEGDIVITDRLRPGLRSGSGTFIKTPEVTSHVGVNHLLGAQNPVISVIITFSNQAEFVKPCIESFRRQTLSVPYEIIAVVDQEEDDGTLGMLAKYHGVHVVRSGELNAAGSRNYGIKYLAENRQAREHFTCFFDGDDTAYPEYLRKMMAALQDEKYAFSYSRFDRIGYSVEQGIIPRCNVYDWSESVMQYSNITNTPIMIRTSVLGIFGDNRELWDSGLKIMQDFGMNVLLAKAGLRGVHVREHLWSYRHHERSVWAGKNLANKKQEARKILAASPYNVKENKAQFTFVSLISRDHVLEEYFAQIPQLKIPGNLTHWLVYIDTNDDRFVERVKKLCSEHQDSFLSVRFYVTNRQNLVDSKSFVERGMRIAMHIKAIVGMVNDQFIGTPYLFMVEDDTIAPKNAFKKLWDIMQKKKGAVYASGVETGRGSTRHTGVCTLYRDSRGIVQMRLIPVVKRKGIEEIGGGGWYCWMGKISALTSLEFQCDDDRMIGPDVFMVEELSKKHRGCYVDWSVQCEHWDTRSQVWVKASEGRGYKITYPVDKAGKVSRLLEEVKT